MIAALRGNAAAGCRRAVRSSREGARRYSLGEDLRRWAVLVSCDELLPSAGAAIRRAAGTVADPSKASATGRGQTLPLSTNGFRGASR
jgi:hypothetical protein